MSLALPEDEEILSPLHCYMRTYCFEAVVYTRNSTYNSDNGKSNNIKYDIVGIQCIFCKHLPYHRRPKRSITYPSTIENIYYSMETWQRRHAMVCTFIPKSVKQEMVKLSNLSRGVGGGRRKYWGESAALKGMFDTPKGIGMKIKQNDSFEDKNIDGLLQEPSSPSYQQSSNADIKDGTMDLDGCDPIAAYSTSDSNKMNPNQYDHSTSTTKISMPYRHEPEVSLTNPDDKSMVSDYLFLLVSQMERCAFTEADRTGGRSKVKTNEIGFPGLQCKHCCGKAGYGRYFPTSLNQLNLANSDRNMHNHLMKCWKCPIDIKERLTNLRAEKMNGEKSESRGERKVFFKLVWDRLHHHSRSDSHQVDLEDDNRLEENDFVSHPPSSHLHLL